MYHLSFIFILYDKRVHSAFFKKRYSLRYLHKDGITVKRITVALENYTNTIEEMLNDTGTYIKINKDPTKKLSSDIRDVEKDGKAKII